MSVPYYDKALFNKINNWVVDTNTTILSPDEVTELFQENADIHKDKIKLPLIALSRDTEINLDITTNRPLSFDGLHLGVSKDGSKTAQLNAIPMTLNYQIDIFTAKAVECYEYARNFTFNIINHPKLEIELPYNGIKVKHIANIKLNPTIVDNSDVQNRLFRGQFTRLTLTFELQDAYMFNTSIKDNYKLDLSKSDVVLDEKIIGDNHNGFTHIIEKEEN